MTEITFVIIVLYTLASLIVGYKMRVLELKHQEAKRLYDVALHDLYDARFQLLNLTAQDNKGAFGYVYVLK